jgi:hypothetical protein
MAKFVNLKDFWNEFIPFFENKEFIRAINLYHSWENKEEIGLSKPLIFTNRSTSFVDEFSSQDSINVIESLKIDSSINNPAYLCVPGDCIELNNIVLGSLMRLLFKEEIYSLVITLNDEDLFRHIVLSTKYIEPGVIKYDEDSDIVLYDLIYPLMKWSGSTFEKREKLKEIKIHDIRTLDKTWKDYNYISYY